MTFEDMKRELTIMRERKLTIDELCQELKNANARKFDNLVNVSDPSREFISRSKSPDDRIIQAIDKAERKEEYILKKIEALPPVNEDVENIIIEVKGRPGWALFEYYVMGYSFEYIARSMECGTVTIKNYIKKGTEELWQRLQTV